MKLRKLLVTILAAGCAVLSHSQTVEYIKYGDFSNWVTRHIKESAVIGGNERTLYAIGPTTTIEGNKAYKPLGGSPWGTSNVYAKVAGVVKGSNAVFPHDRGNGNKCVKLATIMEHLKVLGLINMEVMVTGSIFLGEMVEPVSSTSNAYSKLSMGVPYAKRPKNLVFDYKIDAPNTDTRVKSTGMSKKKTYKGRDYASVFIMLQRRWEDADGNIHAKRVGTGGELFNKTIDWQNGHKIPIKYGDASRPNGYRWEKLLNDETNYHARNSKGKIVPIIEEGWDSPDATPTHVIVMISSGYYEPFVGTEGLTLYVDNVGFGF